jgi:hypothetical protein
MMTSGNFPMPEWKASPRGWGGWFRMENRILILVAGRDLDLFAEA